MAASVPVSNTPVSRGYLRWRCRRGMKELDVMLTRYLDVYFDAMNLEQRQQFDCFLDEPDTRIWQWLLGRSVPQKPEYLYFVQRIRDLS